MSPIFDDHTNQMINKSSTTTTTTKTIVTYRELKERKPPPRLKKSMDTKKIICLHTTAHHENLNEDRPILSLRGEDVSQ